MCYCKYSDVYVRLWIPGRRCKDNIKLGIAASALGDGLIKLLQPQAFVSVACKNCTL